VTEKPEATETILVVEDDVLIRMPIAQYLRDCGYRVIEAVNADEAMTVLLHRDTVVDIVFSDIEMPGSIDGFGLAKWIREHRPGTEIVLAGTVPRSVDAAKDLCEAGPVPKPYEAQAVHDHIRRLLSVRRGAGKAGK
jgi:DNA-binding NtrC family response regulator